MPQVSMIVPIYKVEEYLKRCIDSILSQIYSDFELLMTDDGSPDRSGIMCDEYALADKRSVVIHQPNAGVSVARNSGLDLAAGKYISFVDSDDWVSENLLTTTIPYMEQGYQSINFGCHNLYYGENFPPAYIGEINNESTAIRARFIFDSLIQYKVNWEPWAQMFRRDVIEQHKIRFPKNIAMAEDMYFTICYYAHSKHHISIENALYYYNQYRENAATVIWSGSSANSYNDLFKQLYDYYKRSNVAKEIMDTFPVLYYSVMRNVVLKYQKGQELSFRQLRSIVLGEVQNIDFMKKQVKALRNNKAEMLYVFQDRSKVKYMMEQARYFVDGNELLHLLSRIRHKLFLR